MACCYSKTLSLNYSNIKSIKKYRRWIDVEKNALPSSHSWVCYIFGKKHFIVLGPLKKKESELLEVALSYTIWLVFLFSKKRKLCFFFCCPFQLEPHFRAVSDFTMAAVDTLIFTIFGLSCFLWRNSATLCNT